MDSETCNDTETGSVRLIHFMDYARPLNEGQTAAFSQFQAAEGPVVLQGWLEKKGGSKGGGRNWLKGGRRNWKRRYFVLSSDCLSYFEDETKERLVGTLSFDATTRLDKDPKHADAVMIITRDRDLSVRSTGEPTQEEWSKALTIALVNAASAAEVRAHSVVSPSYAAEIDVSTILRNAASETPMTPSRSTAESSSFRLTFSANGDATFRMDRTSGDRSGYLRKKGGGKGKDRNWVKGGRRNWKIRWFVLRGSSLRYFADASESDEIGDFALADATAVYPPTDLSHFLVIQFPSRDLLLAGSNDDDSNQWFHALRDAMQRGRARRASGMFQFDCSVTQGVLSPSSVEGSKGLGLFLTAVYKPFAGEASPDDTSTNFEEVVVDRPMGHSAAVAGRLFLLERPHLDQSFLSTFFFKPAVVLVPRAAASGVVHRSGAHVRQELTVDSLQIYKENDYAYLTSRKGVKHPRTSFADDLEPLFCAGVASLEFAHPDLNDLEPLFLALSLFHVNNDSLRRITEWGRCTLNAAALERFDAPAAWPRDPPPPSFQFMLSQTTFSLQGDVFLVILFDRAFSPKSKEFLDAANSESVSFSTIRALDSHLKDALQSPTPLMQPFAVAIVGPLLNGGSHPPRVSSDLFVSESVMSDKVLSNFIQKWRRSELKKIKAKLHIDIGTTPPSDLYHVLSELPPPLPPAPSLTFASAVTVQPTGLRLKSLRLDAPPPFVVLRAQLKLDDEANTPALAVLLGESKSAAFISTGISRVSPCANSSYKFADAFTFYPPPHFSPSAHILLSLHAVHIHGRPGDSLLAYAVLPLFPHGAFVQPSKKVDLHLLLHPPPDGYLSLLREVEEEPALFVSVESMSTAFSPSGTLNSCLFGKLESPLVDVPPSLSDDTLARYYPLLYTSLVNRVADQSSPSPPDAAAFDAIASTLVLLRARGGDVLKDLGPLLPFLPFAPSSSVCLLTAMNNALFHRSSDPAYVVRLFDAARALLPTVGVTLRTCPLALRTEFEAQLSTFLQLLVRALTQAVANSDIPQFIPALLLLLNHSARLASAAADVLPASSVHVLVAQFASYAMSAVGGGGDVDQSALPLRLAPVCFLETYLLQCGSRAITLDSFLELQRVFLSAVTRAAAGDNSTVRINALSSLINVAQAANRHGVGWGDGLASLVRHSPSLLALEIPEPVLKSDADELRRGSRRGPSAGSHVADTLGQEKMLWGAAVVAVAASLSEALLVDVLQELGEGGWFALVRAAIDEAVGDATDFALRAARLFLTSCGLPSSASHSTLSALVEVLPPAPKICLIQEITAAVQRNVQDLTESGFKAILCDFLAAFLADSNSEQVAEAALEAIRALLRRHAPAVLAAIPSPPSEDSYPPFDAQDIARLTGKLEVRSAELDEVIRLLGDVRTMPDFKIDILLTYRSFTTPQHLLSRLMAHYLESVAREGQLVSGGGLADGDAPDAAERRRTLAQLMRAQRLKLLNGVKYWVEKHWHDFDADLLAAAVHFVDEFVAPRDEKLAKQIANAILKAMSGKPEIEDILSVAERDGCGLGGGGSVGSRGKGIFDFSDEDIARQLTLIEYCLFRRVRPYEFLNQAWSKKDKESRAPRLLAFIARFNVVSRWVSTVVVSPERVQDRRGVVLRLYGVAKALFNLGSLNAVLEIISGLNNSAVHRLKRTFDGLSDKVVEEFGAIAEVMSDHKAYKNLRAHISQLRPPCIPYIGVYLTDLTFIDDGNQNYTKDNKVNLAKAHMYADVIRKIQIYQQETYDIKPIPELLSLLLSLETIKDDGTLFDMSLAREPRQQQS